MQNIIIHRHCHSRGSHSCPSSCTLFYKHFVLVHVHIAALTAPSSEDIPFAVFYAFFAMQTRNNFLFAEWTSYTKSNERKQRSGENMFWCGRRFIIITIVVIILSAQREPFVAVCVLRSDSGIRDEIILRRWIGAASWCAEKNLNWMWLPRHRQRPFA